jgi:hypothetical protein
MTLGNLDTGTFQRGETIPTRWGPSWRILISARLVHAWTNSARLCGFYELLPGEGRWMTAIPVCLVR